MKQTAKKQAQAPKKAAEPEPMDTTNYATSESTPMSERTAYAVQTLIDEVEAVFPGTDHALINRNGWGVALGVMFIPSERTTTDLGNLLLLMNDPAYAEDHRISEVTEDADGIYVLFHANATTQDSRASFGLAGAWAILSGEQ